MKRFLDAKEENCIYETWKIKTYGYNKKDILIFSPGPIASGHIEDGVLFAHEGDSSYVLSYKALIYFAERAKFFRDGTEYYEPHSASIAGCSKGKGLVFFPCSKYKKVDGVSFKYVEEENWWLISYKDLQEMTSRAKEIRRSIK